MLPLWVRYYEKHFAAEDLYVLDHDSTDGSAEALAGHCQIVPVHRAASFDHRWLRGTVEAFQAFLLRSYETVLFTEVDEFVVTDPRHYAGLADYIARMTGLTARCAGFNVVQQARGAADQLRGADPHPTLLLARVAPVLQAAALPSAARLVRGLP